MLVDRDLFMQQGFLILRNVVPREELPKLRWHFETALEKQKLLWAEEAGPDDPPGGHWETAGMPTLCLDRVVDPETAPAVEFSLRANTFGVCEQLMQAEPAVRILQMLCSPIVDFGRTAWHRDFDSVDVAPSRGLSMDIRANGVDELQWNIPLYDDDVLWVVPGSHLRSETEEEKRQLWKDPLAPLPGSQPVDLKAGDAVVYTNTILHWGSLYTTKLRRTVHFSYRAFGAQLFPHYNNPHLSLDFGFIEHLSPAARAKFERYRELYAGERLVIGQLMEATIRRDETAFRDHLDLLHPGVEGKMVALILLSQWAKRITSLSRVDVRSQGQTEQKVRYWEDDRSIHYYTEVADRFTEQQGEELRQRFQGLEDRLAADRDAAYARFREEFKGWETKNDLSTFTFRTRGTRTFYGEMPDYNLDQFIASWNGT